MDKLRNIDEIRNFTKNNIMAFLYISTADCNVCKDLLPKVEKMLEKYSKIEKKYVEINEVLEVAGELSVFSVPVLILFIDGRETIRESRYVNLQDLEDKIERYYRMVE